VFTDLFSAFEGGFFSGETLVGDKSLCEELTAKQKGIAFEMEGAGIHAACDGGVRCKPWIIIKAITDFGPDVVEKRGHENQEWGAAVAAEYVNWTLSQKNALFGLVDDKQGKQNKEGELNPFCCTTER